MQTEQIAKRYAAALFAVVVGRGILAQAERELMDVDALLKRDPTLMQILQAPHLLEQDKAETLRRVFTGRLHPVLVEFMALILHKHRVGYLHGMIEHFLDMAAEAQGRLTARVFTAVALNDGERQKLIAQLRAKTDKTIDLDETVDPRLVGGMIVVLKDRIIDGSVRHKLLLLREELMKVTVA
jgi:F-type H+-transporting ATPase subunit delta